MAKQKCQICGEDGYMFYPFCKKHLDMKQNGLIIKNEKTGKWEVLENKKYNNKNANFNNIEEINPIVSIDNENKSRCITCGKKTNGVLFCPDCYKKYKNKELLFKITNCTQVELLDSAYEGKFKCKDGHFVKSKSEREIDNYLFDHEIKHIYEKEVFYGASEKEKLHPDFCLPDYLGKNEDVYLEHWGYNENNFSYEKTKKFKMPIYKDLCKEKGITLICTYEKSDASRIDSALERKLDIKNIKLHTINFEE